ncbi:MAG: helix-turn-helix transcriptional regulator [Anaerotignum sp.]|nr:helix-turn-helix transcriptional regulator [Anaerotignum sp.]
MLEKIKAWCKENDTAISVLEKKCGLGNGTISGWEKSVPRVDSLIAVSKITGLSLDELIGTKNT